MTTNPPKIDNIISIQPVDTQTSPNSNVVTTPTFDTNNLTNLSFQYQGRIPVWTPQVSQAVTSAELGNDITIGNTTWCKGITVTYRDLNADQYTVILDGTIKDNGAEYNHQGTTLGIFQRKDGAKALAPVAAVTTKDLAEAVFQAPPSTDTSTSPNTNVTATPSFDTNNLTSLSFQYQGRIPIWTPQVSQAVTSAELGDDITIGNTTWCKGLLVTYRNLNTNQYTVTLDGQIKDNGSVYNHQGTTLGIFERKDPDSSPDEPGDDDVEVKEFAALKFTATQSVNTPTSPNSNVITTPTFDTNNDTNLSFQYQARIPVWTPQVSQAITSATLGGDITIGDTTWCNGLTVSYRNLNAKQYSVTLDGTIVDNGAIYKHAGTTLGIFNRSD